MALAADDDFRRLDDRAGGGQEPLHAILADPDHMQPRLSHLPSLRCTRAPHRAHRPLLPLAPLS